MQINNFTGDCIVAIRQIIPLELEMFCMGMEKDLKNRIISTPNEDLSNLKANLKFVGEIRQLFLEIHNPKK